MDDDLPDLRFLVPDPTFVVPDIMGTCEGWRTWEVDEELPPFGTAPRMTSVTHHDYFWAPRREMRAECDLDRHGPETVPDEGCTCGFYSAKTLEHLQSLGYIGKVGRAGKVPVVGRLNLWGKVIECDQGWRSEYAYPAELYVPHCNWKLGVRLRDAFGVPVRLLNTSGEVLTDDDSII
jgi:hypothetical protein